MFVEHKCKMKRMQLSKSEEELMNILWKQKTALMKDLLDSYEHPKPATTTIATLLKRMTDKGFIAYKTLGRSREYYPLVKKKDYFSKHVNGLIKNFFNDSASQFASFFTQETQLTKEELEDLKALIDRELKKK
jgi:BlaI family penicillinase repressor